jgi:hypothetical protein
MATAQPALSAAVLSTAAPSVTKRYVDAYRSAKIHNGIGQTIKTVSLILGGLIIVPSLVGAASSAEPQPGMFGPYTNSMGIVMGLFGAVIGAAIGGVGFILGTLIAANAQLLKASLDGAVNSSPFLTDEQRAEVMSL